MNWPPRVARSVLRPTLVGRGHAIAALGLALAACGTGGRAFPDAAVDANLPPPWWQPEVGSVKNWDIQLTSDMAQIDISAPRTMYDLDLWALVPSPQPLTYDDGTTITVPTGALPTAIADLHARSPKTIVICHVETGILDLGRPDAVKFPGYNADPMMIPDGTPPAADSVIGWHVGTSAKRWLDLRAASRSKLVPVMFKRFDLAKQIGCDGVEPDRNLAAEFNRFTGFTVPPEESFSWFTEIANQGHQRKLSTGMKNGQGLASQVDMEASQFDWMMIERCGEGQAPDCDSTRAFINLHKAVLAIDYDHDSDGVAQGSGVVCGEQQKAMIADGLYKDVALTKAVRTACVP